MSLLRILLEEWRTVARILLGAVCMVCGGMSFAYAVASGLAVNGAAFDYAMIGCGSCAFMTLFFIVLYTLVDEGEK